MHRLAIAAAAVRRASLLARDLQATLVSDESIEKKDRSPVTIADFAVQALISLELARSLPEDRILGEEHAQFLRSAEGAALRQKVVNAVQREEPKAEEDSILNAIDRCNLETGSSEGFWTLDPIDGTKGFLRRGQYAIALAYIKGGEVTHGVLGCPNLEPWARARKGALFTAIQGSGCRIQDLPGEFSRRAKVQGIEDPSQASFLESVEAAHSAHHQHAAIADQLGVVAPPVRMDSQAKYGALARALGTIYLRLPRDETYQEKIWDHAAGSLVVTESGGRVTDAAGNDLDFSLGPTLANNHGIVATNGLFHEEVLDAVEDVLESSDQGEDDDS